MFKEAVKNEYKLKNKIFYFFFVHFYRLTKTVKTSNVGLDILNSRHLRKDSYEMKHTKSPDSTR